MKERIKVLIKTAQTDGKFVQEMELKAVLKHVEKLETINQQLEFQLRQKLLD